VLVQRLAPLQVLEPGNEARVAALPQESGHGHEPEKIRVLIVDDSAVVRQTLSEVLSSGPANRSIGTAAIRSSPPNASANKFRT
jgi:hypothetical protein